MKRRVFVGLSIGAILGIAAWIAFPHVLPWVLSRYRSDIQFVVSTNEKKLFLSIDDAPSVHTTEILRVLKKHQVPATFFVIADRVKSPAQLDEIVVGGH